MNYILSDTLGIDFIKKTVVQSVLVAICFLLFGVQMLATDVVKSFNQFPYTNFTLTALAEGEDETVTEETEKPAEKTEEIAVQEDKTEKDGEKGADGDSGAEASAGEEGVDGEDGGSGTNGESGEGENTPEEQASVKEPAADGVDGDTGESGDDGENGTTEDGEGTDAENGESGSDGEEAGDGESGESGEQGDDGKNATDEEEPASDQDAVVETGNATSAGQIQNTGNTNVVNGNDILESQDDASQASSGGASQSNASGDNASYEEKEIPMCSDKTRKDGGKPTGSEGKGSKEESEENDEEPVYCIEENKGGNDVTVENENEANVENNADIDATTGNNSASGNGGGGTINTGDATAILDLFNLINTNVVDSDGLFVLLSNLQQQLLDIDVRDWAPYLENYGEGEGCEGCHSLGELAAKNQNVASIINNIVLRAQTGGNNASGNKGAGSIQTGDAYAAANIINIANTNIINSNYLLFIANNFGDFLGDIVFPNASTFFTSLFSSPSAVYDEVDITNTNNASIANSVGVDGNTGANEANGNNGGFIQTGNSHAAASVFNQANMNLFGGNSFVALVRVSGNWSGDVFGLPEGISWKQTAEGIVLYSDDMEIELGQPQQQTESPEPETPECSDCNTQGGKGSKGGKGENSELTVENTNDASIENNIEVYALTGDNKANGNGKGGSIQTGNAFAAANIVNIANTNVIGKNWLFAMFNILGNFEGNISFGRPDLWIGQRAEIPNDPALPGDDITYHLTIANNGDAPAHNVELQNTFDELFISFGNSQTPFSLNENEISWDLGTLNPGEGSEISFTATIRDDIPFGAFAFDNISSVGADESDENNENNTDVVELAVFHEEPAPLPTSGGSNGGSSNNNNGGGSNGNNGSPAGGIQTGNAGNTNSSQVAAGSADAASSTAQAPNLHVLKRYDAEGDVQAGDSVDYTVIITNTDGGSAYDAMLYDILTDGDGNVVHEEVWELDEVFPDEEITITYTTVFEEEAKTGMYRNEAWVTATNGESNSATTGIFVEGVEEEVESVSEIDTPDTQELIEQVEGESFEVLDSELSEPVEEELPLVLNEQSETQTEEFEQIPEEKPFYASLAGAVRGYGAWLSALAAFSILLLYFLLHQRKAGNN